MIAFQVEQSDGNYILTINGLPLGDYYKSLGIQSQPGHVKFEALAGVVKQIEAELCHAFSVEPKQETK